MSGVKLGNPAPLGLLAFGMTVGWLLVSSKSVCGVAKMTFLTPYALLSLALLFLAFVDLQTMNLMYVEMGWCETDFEVSIAGTAMGLGGMGQVLVAIFEILKGSSFSFAVFGCYGFFWLGWAIVFIERHRKDSYFQNASYQDGNTLWFTQWGVLTTCFWIVTWRKNHALIIVFFFLMMTFYLLAIANATESDEVRKTAGYFGLVTAAGAFYTGVAELINEEYGRSLLPGLRPVYRPQRIELTEAEVSKRVEYDARTNTLFLQFRGLQIRLPDHVEAIRKGVEDAILAAKSPDNRVHVVADYDKTYIADAVADEYWKMAKDLETKYYLSATRFHVTSFGTNGDVPAALPAPSHPQKAKVLTSHVDSF